jgi:hypothetical protein
VTTDPRLLRAAQAATHAAPDVRPSDVMAITRAVLAETDRILEEEANGLGPDLPEWDWASVDALHSPHAVYDADAREFRIVAANPPVRLGDELIVTYEGGRMEPFRRPCLVPVARDLREALAWNREHAAEELHGPYDCETDGDGLEAA